MLNHNAIRLTVTALAVLFFAAFEDRALAVFATGDFVTYRQADWGNASVLSTPTAFSTVYPSGLLMGLVGEPDRYSILFTSGPAVLNYLPTGGAPAAFTVHDVNPTLPFGGLFGGELSGLHLNVDFSDAGLIVGTLNIPFGDLTLTNIAGLPALEGVRVRDFAETADRAIAGDATGFTLDDLTLISAELNATFYQGPSQFAQDHLRLPVDMRGDFNQNGTVDAADYVVWRKTLQSLRHTAEFYDLWRANFGNTTADSGGTSSVPEPTLLPLVLGFAMLVLLPNRPFMRGAAG